MSASITAEEARAPSRLLRKLEHRNVNVGKAERVVSSLAGGSLVAYGIARRGVPGALAGILGSALLYRGATGHCDVFESLGVSSAGPGPGARLRESLTINAPAEELYRYWRSLENLPLFMKHLESVRRTGPLESHWVAKLPGGRNVEWDARIVAEDDGRFIAWETLPGSEVEHHGSVRFRPATGGRGTSVDVEMIYRPTAGPLAAAFAKVIARGAELDVREDLRRFKRIMETGEIPTNAGPSGRAAKETAEAVRSARDRARSGPREPALEWDRELVGVTS